MKKMLDEENKNFQKDSDSIAEINKTLKSDLDTLINSFSSVVDITKRLVSLTNMAMINKNNELTSIEKEGQEASDLLGVLKVYQSNMHRVIDAGVDTVEELKDLTKSLYTAMGFMIDQRQELLIFNTLRVEKIEKIMPF